MPYQYTPWRCLMLSLFLNWTIVGAAGAIIANLTYDSRMRTTSLEIRTLEILIAEARRDAERLS